MAAAFEFKSTVSSFAFHCLACSLFYFLSVLGQIFEGRTKQKMYSSMIFFSLSQARGHLCELRKFFAFLSSQSPHSSRLSVNVILLAHLDYSRMALEWYSFYVTSFSQGTMFEISLCMVHWMQILPPQIHVWSA